MFTDSNSAKVFGSREDYNTKGYSVLGCIVFVVVHHSVSTVVSRLTLARSLLLISYPGYHFISDLASRLAGEGKGRGSWIDK